MKIDQMKFTVLMLVKQQTDRHATH